ncbi:MAG: glycosyltransferase [Chitinophagaceae bacterium]|nr:MAG: glycosyltransferase [Chitinophagaceae bacterium]
MWPLIMSGRLLALLKPLKKEYRVYYFFSFFHIGGAEKVHAQITQATGGKDCIIYFTKKSHNDLLKQLFTDSGCEIRDISRFAGKKWLYPVNILLRGIISGYINNQKQQPVVFNGQNNFGYKISPWIAKQIPQVELIHSLNTFSFIRIPFLPFYRQTVMISQKRIDDHLELYRSKSIPASFDGKIRYIGNAIELPDNVKPASRLPFTVLYAGRGGEEKRLGLIAEIARGVHAVNKDIRFEMMGDVSGILEQHRFPFIHFYGNLSDADEIDSVYQRSSLLIMTSETEGFPMVIIEAMARGNLVLSTAVGDIPRHITDNKTGFLFSDSSDGERIILEGIALIIKLAADKHTVARISENNIKYARDNFGIATFNQSYQQLFRSLNQHV